MSMKSKDVSGTILVLLLSIGWIGGIESYRIRSDIGRNRRDITTSTFPPLIHSIRNSDVPSQIYFPSDDVTVQKTTTSPPTGSVPVLTDKFGDIVEYEPTKTSIFPSSIRKLESPPTQSSGLTEGSDKIIQSISSSTTNIKLSSTLKEDSKFETGQIEGETTESEFPMKKSEKLSPGAEVGGIVGQRMEFSTRPPSICKLESPSTQSFGLRKGSDKISQSPSSSTTNIKSPSTLKKDSKRETGQIEGETTESEFPMKKSEKLSPEAEVSGIVGQRMEFSTRPPSIPKLESRPTQSSGLIEGSDKISQSTSSFTTNIKSPSTLKEDSKSETEQIEGETTESEFPMKKSEKLSPEAEVSGIVGQRMEFSIRPPSIQKLEPRPTQLSGLTEGSDKISQSISSFKSPSTSKEDSKSGTGQIGDEITKLESPESEVSGIVDQEMKFSTPPPLMPINSEVKTFIVSPSFRGSQGSLMVPKNEAAMLEAVKNGRCPWAILACCRAIPRPQQPLVDCLKHSGCRLPFWDTCSTILVDTASQAISERNKSGEF